MLAGTLGSLPVSPNFPGVVRAAFGWGLQTWRGARRWPSSLCFFPLAHTASDARGRVSVGPAHFGGGWHPGPQENLLHRGLVKGTLSYLPARSEAGWCGQTALPGRVPGHRRCAQDEWDSVCAGRGPREGTQAGPAATAGQASLPLSRLKGERDSQRSLTPGWKSLSPRARPAPGPQWDSVCSSPPPQASQRQADGGLGRGTWRWRPPTASPPAYL